MSDEQIKRMRAVLLTYADPDNWAHGEWMGPGSTNGLAKYVLGLDLEPYQGDLKTIMEYAIQQRIGGG